LQRRDAVGPAQVGEHVFLRMQVGMDVFDGMSL
jgi:hypothetical protein